ncbi:energy transducer TonB [Thiomicrorhabdus sediminis]|uniref:Protein TonB n=1 Tax=Thiomicrorhabdus sediminis TaxID=2580412 RepID=A0A4P9K478_9GAMM|nr:energy transducer TonB [Thiomicrorhabdus sediminis]QCU89698.1 energy transducer TonB [Thiomicrorhabdus sediminis]
MKHTSLSFVIAALVYSALLGALFFGWQDPQQSAAQESRKALPISLKMFQISAPQTPEQQEPQQAEIKPPVSEPEPVEPVVEKQPIEKRIEKTKEKTTNKPQPTAQKPEKTPLKKAQAIKEESKPLVEAVKANKTQPKEEKIVEQKPEEKPPTITEKHFQPDDTPLTEIKPTVVDTTPVKRLTTNQIEQAEQRYLLELRQQIVRFAEDTYPRLARRRHWQGQVLLEIVIQPNGAIDSVKILKDSKHHLLDQAALEIFTLRMQNQFKPFPEEIQRSNWTIKVPVNYRLY